MASLEVVSKNSLDDHDRLLAQHRVCSVCWTTRVCRIQKAREIREWFYDAFKKALHPRNERARETLVEMFDSPRRVVLELEPVKVISYDGTKLARAISEGGIGG